MKTAEEKLNKLWYTAPLTFFAAALLPEYVAPVLMVVCFVLVFKNRNLLKKDSCFGSIGTALIVFISWIIIGMIYSSYPVSALASIGLWILMFCGYYISSEVLDSEIKINRMFYCGCLTAGIVGTIGIFQMVLFHYGDYFYDGLSKMLNPFWHFLDVGVAKAVTILPDFIVSAMPRTKFLTFPTRACSTFSNPLFFSAFEVIMLPFTTYSFLCMKQKKERIIGFICMFLSLGGIACSYSRGPYIFAAIVFLCLLLYGGKKTIYLGAVGAAFLSAIVVFAQGTIKRFLSLIDNKDISVNTRSEIFKAVLISSKKHPVFGMGTGFNTVRSILRNDFNIQYQSHAHNIILEILAENGIIGVLLFAALLVVFMINIIKLSKIGKEQRYIAVTLFASVGGFVLCGMTDCLFYGLKPLQYFMLILGISQAVFTMYLKDKQIYLLPESPRRKIASIFRQK